MFQDTLSRFTNEDGEEVAKELPRYNEDPNLLYPRVQWGRLGCTFGELLLAAGYTEEVRDEYKYAWDVPVRSRGFCIARAWCVCAVVTVRRRQMATVPCC